MSLDPKDYSHFREEAHSMLDMLLDDLASLQDRPLWRDPMPAYAALAEPLPRAGQSMAALREQAARDLLPYTSGNRHPGFMGWVQGAGTPQGMIGEMIAAGLNMNVGGRHHVGVALERQVSVWMRNVMGYPDSARGLFTTGASQANFVAVLVARHKAQVNDRRAGVGGARLTGYTSPEVHGCVTRAFEMAGIGSDALRKIAVDEDFRVDVAAMRAAIRRDRAAGFTPFLIVGSAGTVNTGAIDDLEALADLAAEEGLHFHIDGALGAGAMLSETLRPRFAGLERSDSLAFDFHKWMHVPYDAGFLLTRDGEAQRAAFTSDAAYLTRAETGLAAGNDWPCDYGPDLSRGARALKTWFTIKSLGADALAAAMEGNCALAVQLAARIDAEADLERLAPIGLNIVVFRYRHADTDRVNRAVIEALHRQGRVAPSLTIINGQIAIRAALVNHRTETSDTSALIEGVLAIGRTL
jgi:aromatic-L-amino-acid decarboxylase